MIIGCGPAVIGQASEFDYSAAEACRALREEGYETVVVEPNPAAASSDPWVADRTYVEPLTVDALARIIQKERPDALLSTFGGQTALNLAAALNCAGELEKFGVEIIGADARAIARAEDRQVFKDTMLSIGIRLPRSVVATSIEEGMQIVNDIGFPAILRPAYTTGGAGSAIAYNVEEFVRMLASALVSSPIHQTSIEEPLLGWKEIEFELVRDGEDNVTIVSSIENVDPVGVHSGDSTAVLPAQTLAPAQLDGLAELATKAARAVGAVGAAGVRCAVNPVNCAYTLIGVTPRISRSSVLAGKATGFPVALIASKLAIGMTLGELSEDAASKTALSSRPRSSNCAVKVSRFAFEKYPDADPALGTSMKSLGQAMAVGADFKEALQKAIRSLETDRVRTRLRWPRSP